MTAPSATTAGKPFAVVTGGSNGIGLELARQFARHGYDLLIAAEPQGLEQAAHELGSLGVNVDSLAVDLTQYDDVEKLWSAVQAAGRPLDAIAINAGVGVGGDFGEQTDLKEELSMIALNITSSVHLAKRVVPAMTERGQGRILFTSSVAALMPAPYEAVYGATKAFLLSFSEALREELKETGVTVTALMPGVTDTDFFHRADMDDTSAGQSKKDDPADVAQQGFDALMAGKDKVVAGSVKTKVMATAAKILPSAAAAAGHRTMSEPGSGN